MTARDDLLQLFADWGVNSGKGARERADRILAKHQTEVRVATLREAADALESDARKGDQDGLTRIYKRAAVDFLRGMAAEAAPACPGEGRGCDCPCEGCRHHCAAHQDRALAAPAARSALPSEQLAALLRLAADALPYRPLADVEWPGAEDADRPACRWPDCLTPEQRRLLDQQVDAGMRGMPTTPIPDQRGACGCADRPSAPAGDECRCCGKDTAACLCEPDVDGTCVCAQALADRPADDTQQQEQPVGVAQAKLLAEAATRAHDGTRPADDTATYEVWPLTRVLAEVRCGSEDWPWEDEWADLDRHHAEQLTLLEHEIAQHGIKDPVVIGSDGRLWDGHHRLRVAVRLGIEWVPVEITPSDDTQQQETQ